MGRLRRVNQWALRHKDSVGSWASIISIVSVPLVILGLLLGYFQIRDYLTSPDIKLRFLNPTAISYKVVNPTDRIAEDVLVSYGIFDLDAPGAGPVPIPAVSYEYVNRKSERGPFSFLSTFGQTGHRYFGIVYVGCRGCQLIRTYWLFAKHGEPEESFYAERNKADTFTIDVGELSRNTTLYLDTLISHDRRIFIRN